VRSGVTRGKIFREEKVWIVLGELRGEVTIAELSIRTDREALKLPISTVNHCVLSIVVATPNRFKQKIASPILREAINDFGITP
jgi:hypothetical protein